MLIRWSNVWRVQRLGQNFPSACFQITLAAIAMWDRALSCWKIILWCISVNCGLFPSNALQFDEIFSVSFPSDRLSWFEQLRIDETLLIPSFTEHCFQTMNILFWCWCLLVLFFYAWNYIRIHFLSLITIRGRNPLLFSLWRSNSHVKRHLSTFFGSSAYSIQFSVFRILPITF